MDSAKRVFNGTWGEVWLDGVKFAEITGCNLKVAYNKTELPRCGEMMVDTKIESIKGTGSLKFYKINSHMALAHGRDIQSGIDRRFTIISKLADPDAYGAERVAVYGVSFDDLTLADWEAKTTGKVEAPFTFTKFDLLDAVVSR